MATNIPNPQQQTSVSVPVTLVTTVPLGVPPLAQLTPSGPGHIGMQMQQTMPLVQNTLATNSMQVPSVVASPMVHTVVTPASKPHNAATNMTSTGAASTPLGDSSLVSRSRLQDLVREVDSTEQLDEEVEELLLQLADDFVETTVNAACMLAKHRKASTVEVRDVQLYLERNWNMWTPGFGTDELRPYKRAPVSEAHKQRLALIRKAIKKY